MEVWLRKSRIFVLTSESEGLSLSMMEAMRCGLPAIVPRVGDLCELVVEGKNGHLVNGRTPDEFAARIVELLSDHLCLDNYSKEARRSTERYALDVVTRLWDEILESTMKKNVTSCVA